jgi:chemotaxis protein MotB
MRFINIIIAVTGFTLLTCAPPRQFKALQNENKSCREENDILKSENEKLTVANNELRSQMELTNKNISSLLEDSTRKKSEYDHLLGEHNQLKQRYQDLYNSQETIIEGSDAEKKRLLEQLKATQEDLYKREDELNRLSATLDEKKANLEQLKNELEKRNASLIELENILHRKDSAVNALKHIVSEALLGFENQGLTVSQKNGKVYVSLEEQLLFKSGSTEVDVKGINALKKLVKVLEQNPDINIMIEGHTDDVKVIPGSAFKDNWDLSVQRATAIVRILLDGSKIDPKRLTASGKGEFMPIDNRKTPEARQKNRRTEIILTPKLDELFKILENN